MDVIDNIIIALFIVIAKIACRGSLKPSKWGERKGPLFPLNIHKEDEDG